jgi:hypothetical protein
MTDEGKVKRKPRCQSCLWWERSNNFRAVSRDWGLCHFWGGNRGFRIPGGFVDVSYGHEPRGSDTCGFHNSDPVLRGTFAPELAPRFKCEGEFRS